MKKVIISIACCALVAPLAFAKDKKGKELKQSRAFLAETPMAVTVTAPSPNQRVEGALAASYQPPGTIVVRQNGALLPVMKTADLRDHHDAPCGRWHDRTRQGSAFCPTTRSSCYDGRKPPAVI